MRFMMRRWPAAAIACGALAALSGPAPAQAQLDPGVVPPPPAAVDSTPAPVDGELPPAEPLEAEEPVPELDDIIVAPPPPAPRPPQTNEFENVEPLLEVEPLSLTLDDGLGDETPWTDYDAYTEHGPPGLVHLGGQLRVSALFETQQDRVPTGPSIELAALADFRFSRRSPWHFRVALGISWQTHVERFLGAGRTVTSSPGAIRLRIQPLALDIGRFVAIRLGPSIGAQLVPRVNETPTSASVDGFAVEVFGGGSAEIALRLLDGLLEIGVHGGMQLTGVGDAQRPSDVTGAPPWRTGVVAQPVLGASATGLLP